MQHLVPRARGELRRLVARGRARLRRRRVPSPFVGAPHLVLHACYHKVGTVWFGSVLRDVAATYGLAFHGSGRDRVPPGWADVFFQHHGRVDLDDLPAFRGTHVVRDPRDIAVSGYRYHLWTDEAWVHRPLDRFDGRSYQEELQRLPEDEGLLLEIRSTAASTFAVMRDWQWGHPDVLEFRFEELMDDAVATWRRVFTHYGFTDEAVARGLEIADHYSADRVRARHPVDSRRARHVRGGGASGRWADLFDERHHRAMEEVGGDLLDRLGYRGGR